MKTRAATARVFSLSTASPVVSQNTIPGRFDKRQHRVDARPAASNMPVAGDEQDIGAFRFSCQAELPHSRCDRWSGNVAGVQDCGILQAVNKQPPFVHKSATVHSDFGLYPGGSFDRHMA